jgi:REP element-mobilizing transposase RayT
VWALIGPSLYLCFMAGLTESYPQFFTATILEWQPLLLENRYKDIIIDSLRFMVQHQRVVLYSFVIMPNHIHLIWQWLLALSGNTCSGTS